jgi:hypothetical protein
MGVSWRGVFVEGRTYRVNDLVRHAGRVWVATATVKTPPPSKGWDTFLERGDV